MLCTWLYFVSMCIVAVICVSLYMCVYIVCVCVVDVIHLYIYVLMMLLYFYKYLKVSAKGSSEWTDTSGGALGSVHKQCICFPEQR